MIAFICREIFYFNNNNNKNVNFYHIKYIITLFIYFFNRKNNKIKIETTNNDVTTNMILL